MLRQGLLQVLVTVQDFVGRMAYDGQEVEMDELYSRWRIRLVDKVWRDVR